MEATEYENGDIDPGGPQIRECLMHMVNPLVTIQIAIEAMMSTTSRGRNKVHKNINPSVLRELKYLQCLY